MDSVVRAAGWHLAHDLPWPYRKLAGLLTGGPGCTVIVRFCHMLYGIVASVVPMTNAMMAAI